MEQEVYIDILFLINFSMDYLCLYICAKIMRRRIILLKMLIAAAIGAAYSVISLFLPLSGFWTIMTDIIVCVIICFIAFYEKGRSAFLCAFLFVGISMMTGGCMTAIFNLLNKLDLPLDGIDGDSISTYLFALVAAIAGLISLRSGQVISKKSSISECSLEISIGDKKTVISALSDSGNLVKDPISGKSVVLIDRNKLALLIDVAEYDRFISGDSSTSEATHGIRLIPIKTASGKGMLAASRPDKLIATFADSKGKHHRIELDALISPSDIGNSASGCYAVIPAEILKI